MEVKTKINSGKKSNIISKKIYQNPFKKDIIYKSNKIKTQKFKNIIKDNLLMYSNTIKKLSQISTEKNILNQSLNKNMSINYYNSNNNILNSNKNNFSNKKDIKVGNIDFKKISAAYKPLTETKIYGNNTQEAKSILEKIQRKNIFGINSNKNFRNKNYKSIKNNNKENTFNLLNPQILRSFNKPKLQSDLSTTFKKLNLNINYSSKVTKSKRYLQVEISPNDKNKIRNFKNILIKTENIYKSDANILIKRATSKNKSKYNKKLDNSIHKKIQKTIYHYNKLNKKSKQKILQPGKKNTEDLIKGLNYTIIANNKSANTKPTNISSFIISEKKIEKNDGINNYNKIEEKDHLKSTYFKEHMKFIDLSKDQKQILLMDNFNKTKESDSKFLNYELGQTNGLSFTDSIFYSLENPHKNENNQNKIIECEHSVEYMEKYANEFLNSNKYLQDFIKNKTKKDSYYDITDNNLSSLDELKNGEDIQRIINLKINLKK